MANGSETRSRVYARRGKIAEGLTTRYKRRRLLGSASVLVLVASLPAILISDETHATCSLVSTDLTCSGDLSGGFSIGNAIGTLTVSGLTTNIGGTGLRIQDTSSADFMFNANLDTFAVTLTGGSLATRNGFHILTDGSITGLLAGDITGQVASNVTNSPLFPPRNFAALGFEAGTGINVTRTGDTNVTLPTLSRISTSTRADVVTGRFAAIRAESEAGNVSLSNTGVVVLDGGQRIASNTRTSGTAGTRSEDFTNGVSDIAGISAQGNGALTLNQIGNVTVSGGGADLSATSVDGRADVFGTFATTTGVYIPAFSRTGGAFDPTLPRFETIDVDVTGNVQVTGGDISADATVNSVGGETGEAILQIASGFNSREAVGIQVGSGTVIGNGQTVDLTVNGNIDVRGGSATGTATASLGGSGETAGRVYSLAGGQNAIGMSLTPDRGPDLDLPTEVDVLVNGDVSVFGGNASSTSTGAGTGDVTRNTTVGFDNFETAQRTQASGGSALGLRFMRMSNIDSFDMNGAITVGGGSATAQHTGDNEGLWVIASGGGANGFFLQVGDNDAPHQDMLDIDVHLAGPDVMTTVSGAGVLGRITSGFQRGASIVFLGDGSQLTYSGNITNTVGTHSITATDGAFVDSASAGFFVGVSATSFDNGIDSTLIYDGAINLTGADITVSGDLSPSPLTVPNARNVAANSESLVGQGVAGIVAEVIDVGVGDGGSRLTIDHRGTINLTAGNGAAGAGVAQGISLLGSFNPNLNGRALISGTIDVNGADRAATRGGTQSAGVIMQASGLGEVDVNGGTVTSTGDGSSGVQANSLTSSIIVRNGGTVTATGIGAAGIGIGGFEDFSDVAETPDTFYEASTNTVTIGPNGTVISTDFIGIQDVNESIFLTTFNSDDRIPEALSFVTENATTVDIAGTVTGGNGTAIDLGNGADTAIFRQTAVINGITLLGAGEDRFLYQGFTETKVVDGGDDRDRVVVNADSGADDMFDPTVNIPNFTNFEAITKTGAGTLTVGGVPFAGMLDYEVDEGLGIIGTDQPNIDVIVASGATFRTDRVVGDITNLAGGLVQGTGTSGNFTNNGTFAPGNSIGTFNVGGNLVLGTEGTLAIEIEAPDQTDLVNVAGTTTLGGTLAVTGLGMFDAFAEGQTYTIIDSADAVSGTFATISDNLPDLDVMPQTVDGGDGGQEVVLSLIIATGSGNLSDKSVVPNAQQAQIGTGRLFGSVLHDRMTGNGSGQSVVVDDGTMLNTYAPKPATRDSGLAKGFYGAKAPQTGLAARPTRTAWLSGLGGFDKADTTAVAPGYRADSYGVAGGIHFEGTATGFDWLLGGAIGYTRSDVTSGAGSSDVDTVHIGAYGRIEQGPARLSAQLSYGLQDYDFTRAIPAGGGIAIATGNAGGHLLAVSVAGAYDIAPQLGIGQAHGLRVAPAAALGYVYSRRNSFTETGAGILNQAYGATSFGRGYLRTGIELSAVMQLDDGTTLRPRGGLHWEWGFGDNNAIVGSTAAAVAGSSFTSAGALEADSGFVAAAGFDLDFNPSTTAQFFYEGTFFDGGDSHRLSGGLKMKF